MDTVLFKCSLLTIDSLISFLPTRTFSWKDHEGSRPKQPEAPHHGFQQFFSGHSGQVTEPTWLGPLYSEKCIDIQGITNSTAALLVV